MALKFIFSISIAVILSGCSITQKVEPVPANTQIDKVWIEDNPKVKHDNFDQEMAKSIEKMGFKSEVFPAQSPPEDAQFIMKYTARWRWDLAVYLGYLDATLYHNNKEIGGILYDALSGGANMNKFGTTMGKVDPLLDKMLAPAKPVESIPPEEKPVKTSELQNKLQTLHNLKKDGLISEKEYSKKKQTLLEDF